MHVEINGERYNLSQQAEYDLLRQVEHVLRTAPIERESIRKFDLVAVKSIGPFIYEFFNMMLEMYGSLSTSKKVMAMAIVRTVLSSLESKFGADVRPPKKADPVIHAIEYIGKRLMHEITTFEKKVMPNVCLKLETHGDEITYVSIDWSKDSEGRALAIDGHIGVRKDNGWEKD